MNYRVLLALQHMLRQQSPTAPKPWVDIRLRRDDVGRAIAALELGPRRLYFDVDRRPSTLASMALEWQLSVEGITEEEVAATLAEALVVPLAIRQR
jgi:hypothetical protein